ncbi:MAG: DUF3450 family protein, partial [Desulfobacteraceae bacterium]
MTRKAILLQLLIGVSCYFSLAISFAETNNTEQFIEKPVKQSIDTRQKTQQEQEEWRLKKEKLIAHFEQLQQEQTQLQQQRAQIQEQVTTTQKRLAVKKKQLADIEQISIQIKPFLDELVGQLKLQIENDLPFLNSERSQRLEKLETLMTDP